MTRFFMESAPGKAEEIHGYDPSTRQYMRGGVVMTVQAGTRVRAMTVKDSLQS